MYGDVMTKPRFEDVPTGPTAAGPALHFDLAPAGSISDLLAAASDGEVSAPYAAWHGDRKDVLALIADAGMFVGLRLHADEGQWICKELAICAGADSHVTPDGLSAVNFVEVTRAAAELAADLVGGAKVVEQLLAPWRVNTRGSGKARDDIAYAALAFRYVQLVNAGERHPAKALGQQLGMSPVTVSQRIREARNEPRNLLSESTPGSAGGQLTDKAQRIIAASLARTNTQREA